MMDELETRDRAFFEAIGAATVTIAEDTTIIMANDVFVHLSGYSKVEIEKKKSWTEFIAQEDLAKMTEYHRNRRRIESSAPATYEAIFVDRAGSRKNVQVTVSVIRGDSISIATLLDIGCCKQAEILMQKYRLLFDQVRDIVLFLNSEGRIIEANRAAEKAYGYERKELMSMKLCNLRSSESQENIEAQLHAAHSTGVIFEVVSRRKDGSTFIMEVNSSGDDIMGEQIIISIGRDITERKIRENQLLKSQAKNQALLDAMPDIMLTIGRDGTIKDHRPKPSSSNESQKQLTRKKVYEILPKYLAIKTMRGVEEALDYKKIVTFECKFSIGRKKIYYEVRLVASDKEEVLAIVRDVTDRKQMEQEMKYLNFHDALTGLYNRTYFEQEIKRLESVRHDGLGIVTCDVDGLKLINDSLGHQAGDRVLQGVAEILKSVFRAGDTIARIGGDEFAVILPTNSAKLCQDACSRIDKMICRYSKRAEIMPIGVSVGYAVCKDSTVNLEALFKEADTTMYRQKLHHHRSSRSAIVEGLTKALQTRDFITEGHGERLQQWTILLAKAAGISDNSIPDLSLLALFHDIGKVGIPDNILFKAGRLTEEEYAIMKDHCEIGYRIAISVPDLVPIADWIFLHHEWWNGAGYPTGIEKTRIPIECRILSIADAFDAMTNNRPYRRAMKRSMAIAELRRCSGTQFDPELVSTFIQAI